MKTPNEIRNIEREKNKISETENKRYEECISDLVNTAQETAELTSEGGRIEYCIDENSPMRVKTVAKYIVDYLKRNGWRATYSQEEVSIPEPCNRYIGADFYDVTVFELRPIRSKVSDSASCCDYSL
jgi:hypothetical protein